jgi:hypothetical protein
MRFTVHKHKREWIVFDNQERLAVLNYRTEASANNAARGCNAANRVIPTPF